MRNEQHCNQQLLHLQFELEPILKGCLCILVLIYNMWRAEEDALNYLPRKFGCGYWIYKNLGFVK